MLVEMKNSASWSPHDVAMVCVCVCDELCSPLQNTTKMKLLVLLALLFGAISAIHLKTEMSNFESSLGDEILSQDKEMPELEAEDAPLLTEEEWGSGREDAPEEEGALESVSALNELDKNLQCPKEEDTVKLECSPACKTCRYLLVRKAFNFNKAQLTCRRCYRGNLVSIHSFSFNSRIQCTVSQLNQGQVWIGGLVTGMGLCRRFRWVDGSSWNFAYWAPGQPSAHGGRCVSLCTQGEAVTELNDAMKLPLLLPVLLLGTVSALHLENGAPHLESGGTQADLGQDLEDSRAQEGQLALTEEAIQSEAEEAEASGYQDDFEDGEAMESDPAALDKDLDCPRKEDTVQLLGSPGCKTCRYLLVQTPRKFRKAQHICKRCYRGNLISIHSYSLNHRIQSSASGINQGQIWIGGIIGAQFLCKKFRWTDGSSWNFGYWAPGQPGNGRGRCVALCTRGGHWRRTLCKRRLPFVCSF
ncbi:hypothetical protein MC885_006015 [Smutsia gigantea]|nr:hypothetical protein MC885_006015 [Smutsia gigantea]